MTKQDTSLIDFWKKLKQNIPVISILLFWCFNWLNLGIYTGGDGYSLGFFRPEMEYILPISLVFLLVSLFGSDSLHRPKKYISWVLLALPIGASLLFSDFSIEDMPLWPVWILSGMALFLTQNLFLQKPQHIRLMWLSLLVGSVLTWYGSSLVIPELLGVNAVVLVFFLLQQAEWKGNIWLMLLGAIVAVFASQNLLLGVLVLGMLFTGRIWGRLLRRKDMQQRVFVFFLLGLGALVWAWFQGVVHLPHFGSFIGGDFSLNRFFFGVGGGMTPEFLQAYSRVELLPEQIISSNSGLINLWQEYGFVGLLGLTGFIWFARKRKNVMVRVPLVVILWVLLVSGTIISTEQGVVLWIAIIVMVRGVEKKQVVVPKKEV